MVRHMLGPTPSASQHRQGIPIEPADGLSHQDDSAAPEPALAAWGMGGSTSAATVRPDAVSLEHYGEPELVHAQKAPGLEDPRQQSGRRNVLRQKPHRSRLPRYGGALCANRRPPRRTYALPLWGVRPWKRRRFSSGWKSHPAMAQAGSNRSSYGGDEPRRQCSLLPPRARPDMNSGREQSCRRRHS
jgi:hypothetical protein